VDVGWLVGLLVSGLIYWMMARSLPLAAESEAVRESDRALGRLAAREHRAARSGF